MNRTFIGKLRDLKSSTVTQIGHKLLMKLKEDHHVKITQRNYGQLMKII
jgi:hypothetical protein